MVSKVHVAVTSGSASRATQIDALLMRMSALDRSIAFFKSSGINTSKPRLLTPVFALRGFLSFDMTTDEGEEARDQSFCDVGDVTRTQKGEFSNYLWVKQSVPLSKINPSGLFDPTRSQKLKALKTEPPPVVLVFDHATKTLTVKEGTHRLMVAQAQGLKALQAFVGIEKSAFVSHLRSLDAYGTVLLTKAIFLDVIGSALCHLLLKESSSRAGAIPEEAVLFSQKLLGRRGAVDLLNPLGTSGDDATDRGIQAMTKLALGDVWPEIFAIAGGENIQPKILSRRIAIAIEQAKIQSSHCDREWRRVSESKEFLREAFKIIERNNTALLRELECLD